MGAAVAISSGYPARSPALAAGRPGYLMLGSDSDALSYANLSAVAIGCTLDSTPPGCPGALTGTENGAGAALSWLPAADAETGIAYYRVYRNGVAIGDTDATTFTAPMLDGLSNTFGVQSVNAAQMQNTACTATVTLVSSPPASSCPSPTPGTRRQTGGTFSAFNAALAWDGREFGAAYAGFDATGGNRIYFRRLFADGTPDGAPLAVSAIASADIPAMVWTGSEYGLAYTAKPGAYWQIFFQRISREGALIGAPVKISVYGDAEIANANGPALAWSGSGYLVAWRDERNGTTNRDIYATWLNPDGTVANGGLDHDLPVVTEPGHQFSPTVVWSTTGGYVLAWQDRRSGVRYEIWGALWYPQSAIIPFTAPLATPPSGSSYAPRLASSGANLGLVWEDNRGGEVSEVYFRRLSAQGEPLGAEQRITSAPDLSSAPRIVWNGSEYGVFWGDARNGSGSAMEPYYQRLAADGGLLGGNLRLAADARAVYTNAAWSGKGWLVSVGSYDALTGDVGVAEHFALGCGADATGASCPSNPVAYGVSGTSATFSWLPAQDSESGVAYYQVYRDNAPAGTTAANYLNFTGLATGTTYNLAVQPVNGAGVTAACATALYVRTGSSLTLMLNKSGGDASLAWTDGGQNNYQVYRGVRPQVMGLELSTPATAALDTGALDDTLSYFYSIDVPFE